MKCLVTGAAGFIGQNLVKRLCAEGADVTTLDHFNGKSILNVQSYPVELVKLDVRDAHLHLKSDFDVIYHFGAPSSVIQYNKNPVDCTLNTLLGFKSILTLAKQCNAKLIYPSSGNVYGTVKPPQEESHPPHPNNMYAACKLVTEHMARDSGVESVGLRIFASYGPHDEQKGQISSVATIFLINIEKNKVVEVYGDGMQSRDFIYIDDVVEGIIQAGKRDTSRIVNLGSGEAHTFNELIKIISNELGITPKVKFVEKPATGYVENTRADIYNMTKMLGVKPRSLKQGIHDYLEARGIK